MADAPRLPTIADFARNMSQLSGETITEAQVLADVAAGAPSTPDGRINIILYLAWLLKHEDDPA